jgi:quercetin dioxygenase-like cupin family protein
VRKTRPLPEVPAGERNLSSYAPAKPYVEAGPAVLTRTLFEASAPSGYSVEVRDIFVDPRKQSGDLRLPGAAFLEVRYGAGVMRAGNQRQELKLGSIVSIPQGQSFSLESTSDEPLTIRVDLIRAH